MKKISTRSEQETYNFGVTLGRQCRGGEVFLLCGDLGAGKTKLLQGLAAGLGVKDKVNSPTFNILKIYRAKEPLKTFCHIDAYRLRSAADLLNLGVEEFFNSSSSVTAIEWAERVKDLWPPQAKVIKITVQSETRRLITY